MHFLKLTPFFLAASATVQNAETNIIFTGFNYGGKTKAVATSESCESLTPPFQNDVKSLKLAPNVHCELFKENSCSKQLDDITEDNPHIDDWYQVRSIRCPKKHV